MKLGFSTYAVTAFAVLSGIFLLTIGGVALKFSPSMVCVFPLVGGVACLFGGVSFFIRERQRWNAFECTTRDTLARLRVQYPQHASRPRPLRRL